MKKNPINQPDWHERRIEEARNAKAAGKPAGSDDETSAEASDTASRRKLKPGEAGLANELRPGLGTRRSEAAPARAVEGAAEDETGSEPKAKKLGYEEPRPDPREQAPDSLAHEQERSTGVSGHSSGS